MSERRLSPAISILALATALAQAALGDAVIGTGTPESCTEQALRTAFYVGGNITFDCGPNPVTITVTTPLATPYRVAVNIDGGNLITLSGGGKTRVLEMPEGPNSLSNITIADGMHPVQGSAMVGGALVDNCTFLNNTISSEPLGGGGAIYAGGSWPVVFHVSNSTFLNNKGGAIVSSGVSVTNCTFVGNSFRWGGGVLNFGGDLTVANSLFVGNGGGAVIEDVLAKATVTITDSTFVNNSGGAIDYFDPWVESTVSNCTFTSNRDGAIYTNGTLTVQTSVFTDNDFTAPWASTVTDLGGAIRNVGALMVTDSTFTGNTGHNSGRTANGGAICNYGTLLVANSTFVDSSVMTDLHPAFGGAIFNGSGGTLAVSNSTFSGNTAIGYGNDGSGSGGVIANQGYLSVVNSTFVGGHATNGGAIFNVATGTADLANTIISWSQSGGNCSGTMRDGGHNMSDDGSCGFSGTSRNQTNPMLDPAGLANNGGPTQTIGLLYFSPAINAGDETICAAAPVNNLDQRGYVRPGNGATNCSIGAFEFSTSPPPHTPTPSFTNTPTPTPTMPTPTPSRTCIVGTGASASCTEAALDACLPGGGSFGGIVTFNCGGATTIIVSSTKFISRDTTIDGGGSTISGTNRVSVFAVNSGVNFTIQNLTIANVGRAIVNNSGTLTVKDSTFSGNLVADSGGAIANFGTLAVTNSTFAGNITALTGGAIDNHGILTITNSTFWHNSGAGGGAIFNAAGTLLVTNSTFGKNYGDGLGDAIFNAAGNPIITNSIVAGGLGNCYAAAGARITDGGHNIDTGLSCGFGFSNATGSLTLTNPSLAPGGPANNGGPTRTIALQASSPAINAGDESVCTALPLNNLDQRGYVRPGAGAVNCSIGAYEYNSPGPPQPCVGDCSGRGQVTVDNILAMVNIALGNATVSTCPAGNADHDTQITVDEILAAVSNALTGCPTD